MMKPFHMLLSAAALASTVLGQNVFIAKPSADTKVKAGSKITVELDKPWTTIGSLEVAVAIGIVSCRPECPDPSEALGEIIYSGGYDPKLHNRLGNPYQNFTVTIPSGYSGHVQLGVAHFFLVGAGPSAQMQFASTKLNVVA